MSGGEDPWNMDYLLGPSAPRNRASGGGVSYDAASSVDQLMHWAPALRSADVDMLFEKGRLDARARDMLRNSGYVANGMKVHKDSIVGEEYRLNAKPSARLLYGDDDETWEQEASEEIEQKFRMYAESPQCWADAQRVNTLTGLVRLAVGQHVMGGEVLAVAKWKDDGRAFASNILMIDPDRLSSPRQNTFDWRIRAGIERDKDGAPIAYHIRNAYLGDPRTRDSADPNKWSRVRRFNPWGRMQVLHIYETMRPDQSRGIASMVTVLQEMRMLKHFQKTELQRAVIAASYAMSIESTVPAEAATAMGAGEQTYNDAITDYMEMQAEHSKGAKNLHNDGARIPVFLPGSSLKVQNPGADSPLGADFESSLLRHIAAGLNVSYEQLSRDYTKANYSSARASIGDSLRGMRPNKRLIADGTANFIYRLWMEEVLNYDDLECFKRANTPSFYEGQYAESFCAAEWIGAGQGMIDPLKETQSDLLALKAGIETKEHIIARRRGGDWRSVARQIKRERLLDNDLGNPSVYDSTETQDAENSLTGAPREQDEG